MRPIGPPCDPVDPGADMHVISTGDDDEEEDDDDDGLTEAPAPAHRRKVESSLDTETADRANQPNSQKERDLQLPPPPAKQDYATQ